MVTEAALLKDSQKVEATQIFIDQYIGKQNVVYTYTKILFSLKKEELLPFMARSLWYMK